MTSKCHDISGFYCNKLYANNMNVFFSFNTVFMINSIQLLTSITVYLEESNTIQKCSLFVLKKLENTIYGYILIPEKVSFELNLKEQTVRNRSVTQGGQGRQLQPTSEFQTIFYHYLFLSFLIIIWIFTFLFTNILIIACK